MSNDLDEFEDVNEMDVLQGDGEDEFILSGPVESDPVVPFWRLSKIDVSALLHILRDIAQRSTDQISRSVRVFYDEEKPGFLGFTITNKDVYFCGVVPLRNQENILKGSIIFNVTQLEDVAKFSQDLVIYQVDGKTVATFMRGVQPMETFVFGEDTYNIPADFKLVKKAVPADSSELRMQMDVFSSLMGLASAAEDRRIIVKDGEAYGSFISIASKVSSKLPNMALKSSDAKDLSSILGIYLGEVFVGTTKDRIFFFNSSFVYSSFALEASVSEELTSKFKFDSSATFIDCNHFFNVSSYLSNANEDAPVMNIKSGPEGMKVSCKQRNGSVASFTLTEHSMPEMDLDLQVVLAKNVFRVLRKCPTVSLSKPFVNFVEFSSGDIRILQGCKDK